MSRILYVEDEPFLAKIVKETLEAKTYEVVHIDHGSKAVQTFVVDNFDICILDIMLPGKNGFDIAEEIRKIDRSIPIIFLTAKDQTADVVKGFGAGGNDYLRKPFSMEELIARINNLLSINQNQVGKQPKELKEYQIGNSFVFHPKKFELNHNGLSRKLSHKETQILELLCQNKNEVTKRKDILLKAWGDDSFYNSRNLDVYITKLRGYISPDPNVQIITLKGVGYQFKMDVS